MTPQQRAQQIAEKIRQEVQRAAGRGLAAGGYFLLVRVKEAVSVPAPKKRLPGGTYRVLAKATPGAPVRKVSGTLRQRLDLVMVSQNEVSIVCNAKSPRGFPYPRHHEVAEPGHPQSGLHQYVGVTAQKFKTELAAIIGKAVVMVSR